MDCRATNAVMIRLSGDLELMAGGTAVMSLVVLGHEAVTFCAEDLVSAFLPLAAARGVDGVLHFRAAGAEVGLRA